MCVVQLVFKEICDILFWQFAYLAWLNNSSQKKKSCRGSLYYLFKNKYFVMSLKQLFNEKVELNFPLKAWVVENPGNVTTEMAKYCLSANLLLEGETNSIYIYRGFSKKWEILLCAVYHRIYFSRRRFPSEDWISTRYMYAKSWSFEIPLCCTT